MTTQHKKRGPEPGQISAEEWRARRNAQDAAEERIKAHVEAAREARAQLVRQILEAGVELMPKARSQAKAGKPALLRLIARNVRMIR